MLRQLEAISNFGETHLKVVSNSEDILNRLDIKANPKRLQVRKHIDESEIDSVNPPTMKHEIRKVYSKPEL